MQLQLKCSRTAVQLQYIAVILQLLHPKYPSPLQLLHFYCSFKKLQSFFVREQMPHLICREKMGNKDFLIVKVRNYIWKWTFLATWQNIAWQHYPSHRWVWPHLYFVNLYVSKSVMFDFNIMTAHSMFDAIALVVTRKRRGNALETPLHLTTTTL